jgi:hypothetical protein
LKNEHCKDGKVCNKNVCAGCTSDAECDAEQICEKGACIKGNCRSAADCKDGQICTNYICSPCQNDESCGEGKICENQACRAGCREDKHCGQSQVCDQTDLLCKGCVKNEDCSGGLICQNNTCKACTADPECQSGKLCINGSCITGDCRLSSECNDGKVCKNYTCSACTADPECDSGKLCINGSCITGDCRLSSECSNGKVCKNYTCSACTADPECDSGKLCINGSCITGDCRLSSECSNGKVCKNNICSACTADPECDSGKLCINGSCITGDCRLSSECSDGKVCKNYTCSACATDPECESGKLCINGACITGDCRLSSECSDGKVCKNNTCSACAVDPECESGKLCINGACITGNCRATGDCQAGYVCKQFICVSCGANYGQTCEVGIGSCKNTGTWVCTVDGEGTECDATPGQPSDEVCDGQDNNCDGKIDNIAICNCAGSGRDGNLTVTASVSLSNHKSNNRTVADGVAYTVNTIGKNQVTTNTTPLGIEKGDEVLLINLQGTVAQSGNVGNFEMLVVDNVSGSQISFTSDIQKIYGVTNDNNVLTGQKIAIQRVPHYQDVTIQKGGVLNTAAWNGTLHGVLAMRVRGTLLVEAGGMIDMNARGYRGGQRQYAIPGRGFQGESYGGIGGNSNLRNLGGGGGGDALTSNCPNCHSNAGGAGHATTGTAGTPTPWADKPGEGGAIYGLANLSKIYLGSGGGGGYLDSDAGANSYGGAGGAGGGIILISALKANIQGLIRANGLDGETGVHYGPASPGGGGGGAGGSIWLIGSEITISNSKVISTQNGIGGFGSEAGNTRLQAGNGGIGRIRLEYNSINQHNYNTSSANTAIQNSFQPMPSHTTSVNNSIDSLCTL